MITPGSLSPPTKGINAHGVPQRLLSDNGAALNPSRRGIVGQLVTYVTSFGVEAITGKPYKPTTQGKNERFHQTLFRFLDKQPIADSLGELQHQVDEFDRVYNTERPHQGLPGRVTPQTAWLATAKAEPPRPRPDPGPANPPGSRHLADMPAAPGDAIRIARVERGGGIRVHGVYFQIGADRSGQTIYVVSEPDTIAFTDSAGTVILEHQQPAPGVTYVSNGQPRGRRPRTVTDVLTREVSPKS
jgi:putative transposase